jgi:hypothetical protein
MARSQGLVGRKFQKARARSHEQSKWDRLVAENQHLEEIAQGNIERNLSGQDPEEIYDDAYTLAFDALVDHGVEHEQARHIAQRVAQRFAQP